MQVQGLVVQILFFKHLFPKELLKYNMTKEKILAKKGFTIVETLVAVSILVVVISGLPSISLKRV
jgi:prepilin-type N-terminal cleavage/methylation domain-containing protein